MLQKRQIDVARIFLAFCAQQGSFSSRQKDVVVAHLLKVHGKYGMKKWGKMCETLSISKAWMHGGGLGFSISVAVYTSTQRPQLIMVTS